MTVEELMKPLDSDPPVASGGRPVPVLIVDDNSAKRLALKAVLQPLGYSIVEAHSGQEALRCVLAQDFAVILLDVRMPVMDGFETAALIRQRQQSEMTPIIFFTAYSSDEITNTDRYAEGAVDFIFAPVPPEEIRAKVSVFANLFLKAEALAIRARDVQATADQLKFLTDATPIGIFQVDADKRYVYTNPRWAEIMRVRSELAAGKPWDCGLDLQRVTGPAFELSDGAPIPAELGQRFELRIPNEQTRVLLVRSQPIPDGAGEITGWVGTVEDVSTDAWVERALSDARDAADEASQLKSDFLANMSHEIRTPMNGVIGMTELLLETDLDDRQRDYAETVRNSGEALLTIIDDILDFSKIEAGKVEVEEIEFNLLATVRGVVDLLAGPARAKGVELLEVVEQSVPPMCIGDPGRLRQVLTNLIGNAIKFTDTGEIVVRVSTDVAADAATIVRFQVTDTGVGIEPDKLALIFQPFAQADTSTSRKYGGTGLGLAISAQLVALMGGGCGVSSEVGAGSTFWFTIALRSDLAQRATGPQSLDAGLAGVTALVVDDNATQRDVLHDYLTDWGMIVTTADSAKAALATMQTAASNGRPFVIALVDQSMPDMDGLELKDAILLDSGLTARVVLMTSLNHERDGGDAVDSGVAASLSKPVHREDLGTCLRIALGMEAVAVTASPATTQRLHEADAQQAGYLLLAEDNPINQKVAVAMLSGAGYRVDTVPNGVAAVQAAAARSYDAILMDCQMPELSGYEATAAIRAHEGTERHTPIIALTAGARREDRERCLDEGMDSYLAKPLNKDLLLALVAKTVTSGPTTTDPPPIRPASTAEMMVDPAVLSELFALGDTGEHGFLDRLVDQFIRETEPRLVELREAVESGDTAAVSRIAHIIQGSGCQLGGRRLALSCSRLEAKATTGSLSEARPDLHGVEMDYQDLRRTLMQLMDPSDDRHSPCLHA
jgi:CheY-like chemotaxis protein/HPt (histidine-containing phosphotransfer) domain-containing protein